MPEPIPPMAENVLIQLCSQKLGQVDAIDQATRNNLAQNEHMAKQRAELVADVDAIKAAIKTGAPYPPPKADAAKA